MQILIKIWQRLTDPVFFQKRFRLLKRRVTGPMEVDGLSVVEKVDRFDRVIVFVAHPDDETFCSGLICSLVDEGATVEVLCLTRGEGGPLGGLEREELGSAREAEMRKACDVLGVSKLTFLDHVDPVAKEYRVYAPAVSEKDLAEQVRPYFEKADLVVSHGSCGEYWHPAHLLVYSTVTRIMKTLSNCQWMTFLANQSDHPIPKLINNDDPAHVVMNVSALNRRRKAALDCHLSQRSLFARFAGGTVDDFIEKTSIESYCIKDRGND